LLAATAFAEPEPETLARRVFALADKQQFSELELLLATLAESAPASPERVAAVLYASERSYAAGHRPQAARWLKPLAADAPKQFQSAIGDALAWCAVNPTDLSVPTARLLELAERHPACSFVPIALQLRAEQLGAAQRIDEAVFTYHALLAQFPRSRFAPVNVLAVARLHHQLEQHREAWEYLQRLVKDYPHTDQMDDALYLGAQTAQHMGQHDTAKLWLQKLVDEQEASPYWADAAIRLAYLQLAVNELTEAEALAERILQSEHVAGELAERARFLLLQLSIAKSDWGEIESRAQHILGEQPGEPIKTLATFWQAESAYRRGELQLAYTRFLDLSLAIERQRDDWLGVVPLRLAQIETQRQNWSAALEWAELATKDYPRYRRTHEVDYVRGRSLMSLGRFSDARDALQRVTVSDSASGSEVAAMAQWLIGETYFQQQEYELAIASYERTQECNHPRWRAAALLQAAKCCEQLGRWTDAAQRYEQLLHDHADSRFVADARARLEKTQAKVAAQTTTETTTR
jgi:tetratricopeptide (TPR) repeat protein